MGDTHDPTGQLATGRPATGQPATGDAATGAPPPSRTGSVSKLGFDDPTLRPLPPDRLEYHAPHTDAHPERHEHSDVPIRPLAISLAAIALTMAGTFVFVYVLFFHFKGAQEAKELKRTNVPDARPVIAGPRLQGIPGFSDKHPGDDWKDLREDYRKELNGYRKTPDGFAQVPVDRAMELAVERGLFKTTQNPTGPGPVQIRPADAQGQPREAQPREAQPREAQPRGTQPRPATTGPARQGGSGGGGAAPKPRSPQREGGVR